MSIYAIADTHLSFGSDKPMDVFGGWQDYTQRLENNWRRLVEPQDTVVIAGDISWAMSLEEAKEDFRFLQSLPGQKLIFKGNHDYWWVTKKKLDDFLAENNFSTISVLFNNAFEVGEYAVCGSRGWFVGEKLQADAFDADYSKLVNRECERITRSVEEGEKLKNRKALPTVVFLHFPPVYRDFVCEPILKILSEKNVARVYYGHIHGDYFVPSTVEMDGVKMSLVSADYLNFAPERVFV